MDLVPSVAGVAEGGYSLSGGVGVQSRLHGLGLDNVLALNMVDYQGNMHRASSTDDTDLYFALRGAGNGNFGVVTEIHVQLHPLAEHNKGRELLSFDATVPVDAWADFCLSLGALDVPHGFFPLFEGGIVADLANPDKEAFPTAFLYTGDDLDEGKQFLMESIVPLLPENTDNKPEWEMQVLSWYDWTVASGNFLGNYVQAWTGFLHEEHNTIEVWKDMQSILDDVSTVMSYAAFFDKFCQKKTLNCLLISPTFVISQLLHKSPYLMMDIELFGGAIASSATPNETAFAFRDALWNVGLLLLVSETEENAQQVYNENVAMVNQGWPRISQYLNGVYLNYPMESLSNDEYPSQYWGSNLERLMQLKAKYDPHNVFYHPQSIPLPS